MYDLAVIGAGPGGYVAAIRAAQLGLKVACIDKGAALGGTCLNVGCIPSKCLLEDSGSYVFLKNNPVIHGELSCDFGAMMQRKEKVVKGLTDSVANLFKHYGIERIEGTASFQTEHTLHVQGKRVEAKNFIIASGSEPTPFPGVPFDEQQVLSSTGALALTKIPKTMLVIGAGVIGVELASAYQRLGTQVTLVEMLDEICAGMDAAISKMLLNTLKKQGLIFHLGTKVERIEKTAESVTLHLKEQTLSAEVLLVAIGRRPYSEGLNLKNAKIATTPKGFLTVDANFRTSQPHIYAIGDLIEGPMLAHRASDEGVAVAELLVGKQSHVNYLAIPNVVYTHPEAAAVGWTEKEAREMGLDLLIGTSAMRGNPRARCAGDLEGMVKVIGEKKTGRLIGLHILASHASEMIGEGVLAIEKKATLEDLARASHAHPTLSEAIKEAAGSAIGCAIHQ